MATESPNLSSPPADRRRALPLKPLWILAVVAALIWAAIAVIRGLRDSDGLDETRGALTYEVKRGPMQVLVTADGNVESASNIEVKCRVAGGGTILWIVEDGKVVEEGEVIVRLDTSGIDEQLNSQLIVYEKALAAKIQAQQDVGAATISVTEYEEGTFVEQLKQLEADIQVALENSRSTENQLKYSTRMARKGFVSALQREADEFAVERAKLDLDVARTRKRVLVEFTRQKMLTDLEATREASSARLRSEEASLRLEKARLDRLQEQLKNCVVAAPKQGMVVYANDARRSRYGGSSQADVEEGATVRESQALLRLPDLMNMEVKVTIHESRVDQVRPGMPVRIVIQDQKYNGNVVNIANQPERTSWFSANVKEYATVVSIEGETNGLKPGMTAKVTILVEDLRDILTLPVSAVVEQGGKFYCWVKTTRPERRPLVLGQTNDQVVHVVDGVKEGDVVYRNPRAVVEAARWEPAPEESGRWSRVEVGAPGKPPPGADAASREGPPRDDGTRSETRQRSGRGSRDLLQFDKDGDGKLRKEELPERMRGFFDRLDSNGDGAVDTAEISRMRQSRVRGRAEGGESP